MRILQITTLLVSLAMSSTTHSALSPLEQLTAHTSIIMSRAKSLPFTSSSFLQEFNILREQLVEKSTNAQAPLQQEIAAIQTDDSSTHHQKFAAAEAVCARLDAVSKITLTTKVELEKIHSTWLKNIVVPTATRYKSNAETASDPLLLLSFNLMPQEITCFAATYSADEDNPDVKLLMRVFAGQKNDASLKKAFGRIQDEEFEDCISTATNAIKRLAELTIRERNGITTSPTARYPLGVAEEVTCKGTILATQSTDPVIQQLAKYFTTTVPEYIARDFAFHSGTTLRKINYLRFKALEKMLQSGSAVMHTNTSFLNLPDDHLHQLLGDEADFVITTGKEIRFHPGFLGTLLQDQLFDSLIRLGNHPLAIAKFTTPTNEQAQQFVDSMPAVFNRVQADSQLVKVNISSAVKSRFVDTLPAAERITAYAFPMAHALQIAYEQFEKALPEADRKLIEQNAIDQEKIRLAKDHLTKDRTNKVRQFAAKVSAKFFNEDSHLSLTPLGKLQARMSALLDMKYIDHNGIANAVTDLIRTHSPAFFDKNYAEQLLGEPTTPKSKLRKMLRKNFWHDPSEPNEDLEKKKIVHSTFKALEKMNGSNATIIHQVVRNWVRCSLYAEDHDAWVDATRNALAISYVEQKKYLPGSPQFDDWNSIINLAKKLSVTKKSEDEPFIAVQKRVGDFMQTVQEKMTVLFENPTSNDDHISHIAYARHLVELAINATQPLWLNIDPLSAVKAINATLDRSECILRNVDMNA